MVVGHFRLTSDLPPLTALNYMTKRIGAITSPFCPYRNYSRVKPEFSLRFSLRNMQLGRRANYEQRVELYRRPPPPPLSFPEDLALRLVVVFES